MFFAFTLQQCCIEITINEIEWSWKQLIWYWNPNVLEKSLNLCLVFCMNPDRGEMNTSL